jgi:hypothetical protein
MQGGVSGSRRRQFLRTSSTDVKPASLKTRSGKGSDDPYALDNEPFSRSGLETFTSSKDQTV